MAGWIIVWCQSGGSSQAIPSSEIEDRRTTRAGDEVKWRGVWWRVRGERD